MNRADEIEMMTCIMTGYLTRRGRSVTELQDSMQDCGYTDKVIGEIMRVALKRANGESTSK